jgi:hemoglobin
MTDLSSRADIERLVDTFYDRVRDDDLLGPIFNDIARVDWSEHLPKMYAFWEAVLFGVPGFKGNPMATHLALARRTPLSSREFDRWLDLFHATIDSLFAGPKATEAKRRSVQIAATMQFHLAAGYATNLQVTRTPAGRG